MLDQRRAVEKGYITLKEAARIANYSPDYVGQLIRAGKIQGQQVYASTAWVTTADEVFSYLNNKQRSVSRRSFSQTYNFLGTKFPISVYTFIAVCTVSILLMQYILYTSIFLQNNRYLSDINILSAQELATKQ